MRHPALAAALLCVPAVASSQDSRPEPGAAASRPARRAAYDLGTPTRTLHLPPILHEVSAVEALDQHTVLCVQDELGELFTLDLRTGQVRERTPFSEPGDWEGLALAGQRAFVMRSDGHVVELAREATGWKRERTFVLGIPRRDLEGIAVDTRHERLLIAPKDVGKGSEAERDARPIYAFDLRRMVPLAAPLLTLSRQALLEEIESSGVTVTARRTPKGRERPKLALRFSALAVHPTDDDLYLLSAVDRALLVVDRAGRLRLFHVFPESLLPQAEGLTFLPDGDLVVSSEGGDGAAVLHVFRRRR
jgi:uncharacterized protein YjiK